MMKRMIQRQIPGGFLFILLAVMVVVQAGAIEACVWQPYVGAGVQYRHMPFVAGKGAGAFKTYFLEQQLYAGVKFNEYVGLETGYAFSTSQKKTTTFVGGQMLMGSLLTPTEVILSENRLKTRRISVDLVGFIPIVQDKTELFFSAGIVSTTFKFQCKQLADETRTFNQVEIDRFKRNFLATRIIPRIGVGMQYKLSETYAVRFGILGERTSAFKNIVPKERSPYRIALKNSLNAQLSVVAKF